MKAFLLLCLLAFMSCEKDIIDIGKCIYKAPKVQELISDVIVAIATKDYSKLLPKIKEALPELIQIVLGCITDTKAIEEQPKSEGFPINVIIDICYRGCADMAIDFNHNCVKQCDEQRKKYLGNK